MEKLFTQIPRFPSDVKQAVIPVISYAKLQAGDEEECKKVFDASCEHGFFYLDLHGSEKGEQLLNEAVTMFEVDKELFSLDHEELNKFPIHPPRDMRGYKPPGILPTGNGKMDKYAMYSLARDQIFPSNPSMSIPGLLQTRSEECTKFMDDAHGLMEVVLHCLEKELGISSNAFTSRCPASDSNQSYLRLLQQWPVTNVDERQVAHANHTDVGVLTLLFNVLGGLQILPGDCDNIPENWCYIQPKEGCTVVNLGDTLVQWTGGVLRSNLHRVIHPPGDQATIMRHSVGYFLRPDASVSMARLKGGIIPPLTDGEDEETRSPGDWAASRVALITKNVVKPASSGGLYARSQRVSSSIRVN